MCLHSIISIPIRSPMKSPRNRVAKCWTATKKFNNSKKLTTWKITVKLFTAFQTQHISASLPYFLDQSQKLVYVSYVSLLSKTSIWCWPQKSASSYSSSPPWTGGLVVRACEGECCPNLPPTHHRQLRRCSWGPTTHQRNCWLAGFLSIVRTQFTAVNKGLFKKWIF